MLITIFANLSTLNARTLSKLKFCIAFTKIKSLPNFNLALSYKQIEKNSNKFDKCINQEDWIEAFVDAYNYKLVTKGKHGHKRISIRKEGF